MMLATRSLLTYFSHIVLVTFARPHQLIILTEPAWHHSSFWGSRCDSNHTPAISLKPCISFATISAIPLTHKTFHHAAYLTTSNGHQVHFLPISAIFSPVSLHFGKSLLKQTFQRCPLKNIISNHRSISFQLPKLRHSV